MDIGAIPFTSIVEYFRIYKLGEFDDFLYIIRALDNTLLELNREKQKSSEKSGAKSK